MIDIIKCGVRSLRRKKLRTLLTVISISIGVASVVLISSIGDIGKQTINDELSSLGLDGLTIGKLHQDSASLLEEEALLEVRECAQVREATGLNVDYTQLRMRALVANSVVWGIDEDASSFISLEPLYGRMIDKRDISGSNKVCMVDQNVAQAFYKRDNIVGKNISITLGGDAQHFTIIGVVRSGGNILQGLMSGYIPSFVYIPYSTMQQLSLKSEFDQIVVKVDAGLDPNLVGEKIIHTLEKKGGIQNGYRAENIAKQKETLNRLLGMVTLILSLIAGVSLVVSGLGIMTVMLVSVHERTHEIGIKKSIGASRSAIMIEFLVEAFTITLLGSVVGAGIGTALVGVGCMLLNIQARINIYSVIACVAFSILVGAVFGVYPASIAAKLKPVDALRSS